MNLVPTSIIISEAEYKGSPSAFFGLFTSAWDTARCQVIKLETRQEYQEPDSESLRAFLDGDTQQSLDLLEESRKSDESIYALVRERKIDFVRCRPIVFPPTQYLKWELLTYKFSILQGERIFWCNEISIKEFIADIAQHDYMVFDARIAFVHDYDSSGLIRGGWVIRDTNLIYNLLAIFAVFKSNCQNLSLLEGSSY